MSVSVSHTMALRLTHSLSLNLRTEVLAAPQQGGTGEVGVRGSVLRRRGYYVEIFLLSAEGPEEGEGG